MGHAQEVPTPQYTRHVYIASNALTNNTASSRNLQVIMTLDSVVLVSRDTSRKAVLFAVSFLFLLLKTGLLDIRKIELRLKEVMGSRYHGHLDFIVVNIIQLISWNKDFCC